MEAGLLITLDRRSTGAFFDGLALPNLGPLGQLSICLAVEARREPALRSRLLVARSDGKDRTERTFDVVHNYERRLVPQHSQMNEDRDGQVSELTPTSDVFGQFVLLNLIPEDSRFLSAYFDEYIFAGDMY